MKKKYNFSRGVVVKGKIKSRDQLLKAMKSKSKISSTRKKKSLSKVRRKKMSEDSHDIKSKQIVNIPGLSIELIERFKEQMKEENFQGTLEDFIVKIIEFGMKPENRLAVKKHIAQGKKSANS